MGEASCLAQSHQSPTHPASETPAAPPSKKRKPDDGDFRGSTYFKIRTILSGLRPSFIEMGKKRGKADRPARNAGTHQAMTLREENTGTEHVSLSSVLRMQHLQRLAIWSGGEGGISPLSALFGHHLAANAEAVGKPLDSALVPCQRCETILQPGFNCN